MSSVCHCCLSSDRTLSPPPPAARDLMSTLIPQSNVADGQSGDASICWECAAILAKVSRFQLRATRAQQQLQLLRSQPASEVFNYVKSLTSLSTTITKPYNSVVTTECRPDESDSFFHDFSIKNELENGDNFIEVVPDFNTFDNEELDSKINVEREITEYNYDTMKEEEPFGEIGWKEQKRKKKSKKNRENKNNVLKNKIKKLKHREISKTAGGQEMLKSKENEETHLWFISTAPESYECNYCSKMFTTRLRMENHLKRFAGECGIKQNTRRRLKSTFQCPDCKQKFAYRCNLIEHSRTHSGEKPHQCKLCGKKYTQTASLNRHLRTHSEDRRFVCTYCGQRFIERRTLTDHYNTHTGLRPYLCSQCGKSFTQKGALRTHGKTHGARAVVRRKEVIT